MGKPTRRIFLGAATSFLLAPSVLTNAKTQDPVVATPTPDITPTPQLTPKPLPKELAYIVELRPESKSNQRIDCIVTVDEQGNFTPVISEGDINTPIPPASLTKLMTFAVVFEAVKKGELSLETITELPPDPWKYTKSRVSKLRRPFSIASGILMAATRSFNDIMRTVAIVTSELPTYAKQIQRAAEFFPDQQFTTGDEYSFARIIMQRKSAELGMKNSWWGNTHGLPPRDTDHPLGNANVSSVADLLVLTRHLTTQYPEFLQYFEKRSIRVRGLEGFQPNTNHLLSGIEEKSRKPEEGIVITGLKTGYTDDSGSVLIVTGKINGKNIIGVTTGHPGWKKRDEYMRKLLKKAEALIPKPETTQTLVATPSIN